MDKYISIKKAALNQNYSVSYPDHQPKVEEFMILQICYQSIYIDAFSVINQLSALNSSDDIETIHFSRSIAVAYDHYSRIGSFRVEKEISFVDVKFQNQYLSMMKDILRCSIIALTIKLKKEIFKIKPN